MSQRVKKAKARKELFAFLRECNLYPHAGKSLKVLTEHDEGAYLDEGDIVMLIEALTQYIKS